MNNSRHDDFAGHEVAESLKANGQGLPQAVAQRASHAQSSVCMRLWRKEPHHAN